jgi:hypothetical protein
VRPRFLEHDVGENFHIGRGGLGIGKREWNRPALDQHGRLVGRQESGSLNKIPLATAPSGDHANARIRKRDAGERDRVKEADQDEFPVAFLSHIVAEKAGLQIRGHQG